MNASTARAATRGHFSNRALWIFAIAVGAYFVISYVPRYFNYSEASYGAYFWPRANYLLAHILGGLVAIVLGPFQFWSRLRSEHPKIHRVTGRVYLLAILVGSTGGLTMALTAYDNLGYRSGLAFLAVAWLTTATMAFVAVRRRNFVQHRQWMIRSYVVTFAFVSYRLVDDAMDFYGFASSEGRDAMLAWMCWAVPLLLTEVVLQGRQIMARR